MIKENNGWFCIDNDCLQYCKKESDTKFNFIQAVWLDTCSDDERAKNAKDEHDNYAVCSANIDLDSYSDNDKECSLAPYGYTLESVNEIYSEADNQIIAECLFEDNCLYDSYSISGVISMADAKEIIQKYIDEN